MPALSAATEPGPPDLAPGSQRLEGRIVEFSPEPPADGALGVVWISIRPGSSSILDVRGLVVWPGTAIVTRDGTGRPGDSIGPRPGDRLRASASLKEYWSIPPIFDAARIEILGR
ncbi:MAG: hypothetical protein KY397_04005 [Gemmatimonadetes bacterium]|nr:hypothetical protein [Gemmatimonadota bacterium]